MVTPYQDDRGKGQQVKEMFDNIAPSYDFMNRAMTLGIDKLWRKKAVRMIRDDARRRCPGKRYDILDVATGTGDLAILMAQMLPQSTIRGIDLSESMIEVGRKKIADSSLSDRITLESGDCLALPYADNSFDCITVAYGVRNFERLEQGYREMARVLRPGGMLCVIELSTPVNRFVLPLYKFYTGQIIPAVGRLVSKDVRAYAYLPESIAEVAQGERMTSIINSCGFVDAAFRPLTFGVCTIYTARKPL